MSSSNNTMQSLQNNTHIDAKTISRIIVGLESIKQSIKPTQLQLNTKNFKLGWSYTQKQNQILRLIGIATQYLKHYQNNPPVNKLTVIGLLRLVEILITASKQDKKSKCYSVIQKLYCDLGVNLVNDNEKDTAFAQLDLTKFNGFLINSIKQCDFVHQPVKFILNKQLSCINKFLEKRLESTLTDQVHDQMDIKTYEQHLQHLNNIGCFIMDKKGLEKNQKTLKQLTYQVYKAGLASLLNQINNSLNSNQNKKTIADYKNLLKEIDKFNRVTDLNTSATGLAQLLISKKMPISDQLYQQVVNKISDKILALFQQELQNIAKNNTINEQQKLIAIIKLYKKTMLYDLPMSSTVTKKIHTACLEACNKQITTNQFKYIQELQLQLVTYELLADGDFSTNSSKNEALFKQKIFKTFDEFFLLLLKNSANINLDMNTITPRLRESKEYKDKLNSFVSMVNLIVKFAQAKAAVTKAQKNKAVIISGDALGNALKSLMQEYCKKYKTQQLKDLYNYLSCIQIPGMEQNETSKFQYSLAQLGGAISSFCQNNETVVQSRSDVGKKRSQIRQKNVGRTTTKIMNQNIVINKTTTTSTKHKNQKNRKVNTDSLKVTTNNNNNLIVNNNKIKKNSENQATFTKFTSPKNTSKQKNSHRLHQLTTNELGLNAKEQNKGISVLKRDINVSDSSSKAKQKIILNNQIKAAGTSAFNEQTLEQALAKEPVSLSPPQVSFLGTNYSQNFLGHGLINFFNKQATIHTKQTTDEHVFNNSLFVTTDEKADTVLKIDKQGNNSLSATLTINNLLLKYIPSSPSNSIKTLDLGKIEITFDLANNELGSSHNVSTNSQYLNYLLAKQPMMALMWLCTQNKSNVTSQLKLDEKLIPQVKEFNQQMQDIYQSKNLSDDTKEKLLQNQLDIVYECIDIHKNINKRFGNKTSQFILSQDQKNSYGTQYNSSIRTSVENYINHTQTHERTTKKQKSLLKTLKDFNLKVKIAIERESLTNKLRSGVSYDKKLRAASLRLIRKSNNITTNEEASRQDKQFILNCLQMANAACEATSGEGQFFGTGKDCAEALNDMQRAYWTHIPQLQPKDFDTNSPVEQGTERDNLIKTTAAITGILKDPASEQSQMHRDTLKNQISMKYKDTSTLIKKNNFSGGKTRRIATKVAGWCLFFLGASICGVGIAATTLGFLHMNPVMFGPGIGMILGGFALKSLASAMIAKNTAKHADKYETYQKIRQKCTFFKDRKELNEDQTSLAQNNDNQLIINIG